MTTNPTTKPRARGSAGPPSTSAWKGTCLQGLLPAFQGLRPTGCTVRASGRHADLGGLPLTLSTMLTEACPIVFRATHS